eukprot:EG_transcript_27736
MGGKSKNVKKMLNAVVNHPRHATAQRLSAKMAAARAKTQHQQAVQRAAAPKKSPEAKAKAQERTKFLHPDGRLAAKMRHKALSKEKQAQRVVAKERTARRSLERPMWFKRELLRHEVGYVVPTTEELVEWVRRYIARHDAQLAVLAEKRHGSPNVTGLEKDLAMRRAAEREEFHRGFRVPDLLSRKVCHNLRAWDESPATLAQLPHTSVVDPESPALSGKERHRLLAGLKKRKQ